MSFNPYQPPTPAYDSRYTQPSSEPGGPVVTDAIIESLRKTRPWVMFLAILTFVFAGFSLLGGLAMLASGDDTVAFGAGLGLIYIVSGSVYIVAGLSLYRYASSINNLLHGGGIAELERAIDAQARFWQLAGILTLVGVVLMALMIVFVMFAAASAF